MTLSSGRGLRILIVMLTILIALQLIVAGSGYLRRTVELGRPSEPLIVAQIEAAARLIENAPPSERDDALVAISSPFVKFTLAETYAERVQAIPQDSRRRVIRAAYEAAFGDRTFSVYAPKRGRILADEEERFRFGRNIVIVVALKDGSALIVEPSRQYRRQMAINITSSMSAIVGLLLLAGLAFVSLATTRPLRKIAEAAQHVAADLNAPPVAETGPPAVRDLARAFNSMQRDLRKLVSERTTSLAAVAHDFRTYLTRLRLRIERIEPADQREKAIADIEEMSALIDDTLHFASADGKPRAPEEVDVNALVAAIPENLAAIAGRIAVTPSEESAIVLADRLSLQRALINIVENAVKYGDTAKIEIAPAAERIVIVVRDLGAGAPPQALERLADPFFRVETSRSRATGGAGLGLAIAKMLIEGSGGRLSFANESGFGLRVTISLPRAPA